MSAKKRTRVEVSEDPEVENAVQDVEEVDMVNIRMTRSEEKVLLQNVTKRLNYYILRQRERDASTQSLRAELEQSRQRARKDLSELRQLHEDQQQAAVTAQNDLAEQLNQYKEKADRLSRDVTILRNEAEKSSGDRLRVESALSSRSDELSTLNKEMIALQTRIEKLNHDADVRSKTIASLTNQLELTREEVKKERSSRFEAEANAQNNNPNYKREISLLREQIQILNGEKDAWHTSLEEVKAKLRKDHLANLNKSIKDSQVRFEEEKDALANDLRDAFKETEVSFINDIQALEASKARLEEENHGSQVTIRSLRQNVSDLSTARDTLTKENDNLRAQLSEQREKYTNELAERTEMSQRAEQRYLSKSREFNVLMDVKVRLALEIKRYRELMLSAEDIEQQNRLELEPDDADSTSRIVIISMDLESGEIHFKNGSTNVVNLNKWRLYSKKTRKEFIFPNTHIEPGQSFKVFFGNNSAKRADKSTDCTAFSVDDMFSSVDTAILSDGRGKEVSRVDIN